MVSVGGEHPRQAEWCSSCRDTFGTEIVSPYAFWIVPFVRHVDNPKHFSSTRPLSRFELNQRKKIAGKCELKVS